jgi:hypothetical protein
MGKTEKNEAIFQVSDRRRTDEGDEVSLEGQEQGGDIGLTFLYVVPQNSTLGDMEEVEQEGRIRMNAKNCHGVEGKV